LGRLCAESIMMTDLLVWAKQRAMVAAKLATLQDGQRQVGKFADVPTQAEAAANQRGPGRGITG
jgi:hypothetical protein